MNTGGFGQQGLNLPPTSETIHFIYGKRAFFGYHVRTSGEIYSFKVDWDMKVQAHASDSIERGDKLPATRSVAK